MNSLKVFFTLAVLVVSAFVMIYLVEGIYEAKASAPMNLSIAPLADEVSSPAKEEASLIAPLKKVFQRAEQSVREKVAEEVESHKPEQSENQVHHGLCVAAMTGDIEKTRALLDAGISADVRDSFNIRAIARATLWGHYDVVKLLLERGAKVNEQERLGVTLLMLAANKGDKELLELFLEHGADAEIRSEDGETALSIASKKGYTELVQVLEKHQGKKVSVVDQSPSKKNPFFVRNKAGLDELDATTLDSAEIETQAMASIERMHLEQEKLQNPEAPAMLDEEPSANALEALTWAANASKESIELIEADMIQEILDRESVVEVRKFEPEPQAAEIMIEPVKPVFISEPVEKPVVSAEKIGAVSEDKVILAPSAALTRAEPDLFIRETSVEPVRISSGKTGAELMAERAAASRIHVQSDASEAPRGEKIRQESLAIRVDENVTGYQPRIQPAFSTPQDLPTLPLEEDSYVSHESWVDPEMLKRLPSEEELDTIYEEVKKIEVDLSNWSKKEIEEYRVQEGPVVFNPDDLMQAVLAGALHRVRVVIDYGVDVNARGDLEMTPLMVAAQGGRIDVVKFLLTHGADVNAQNIVGQTALRLAILQENTDVVKMLKTYGARE